MAGRRTARRSPAAAPRRRRRRSRDGPEIDLEEFRRAGRELIDDLVEYYRTLPNRPIVRRTSVREVRRRFDEPLPRRGRDLRAVLRRWRAQVVPYSGHLGSPRFFGYVQGSGLPIGALADLLASAQDPNVADWRIAPAESEIERRVVRWMAEMIGYPSTAGGTLTSGGMAANHAALQTALRCRSPYDPTDDGLQSPERRGRFLVYMADHEGHVTIRRVAELLNLGRNAVRAVPSRDDFSLDPDALRRLVREDAARGDVPFCVVGQAGSINVGAIDPLAEIADVCRDHNLWFHVDGAAGAFGALLPELRPLYAGMERADSVTVDPHKWLYLSKECGGLLVQDERLLQRTFGLEAAYLERQTLDDESGPNYRALGPQSSRGFRALKVWLALQQLGTDGYRRLFRQNLACVRHLDARVRADPDLEALHDPRLYIYSFRYRPRRYAGAVTAGREPIPELDRLNAAIAERAVASGEVFLTTTRIRGQVALRVSVCNHRTTIEDIDRLYAVVTRLGRTLDRTARPPAGRPRRRRPL